MVGGIIGRGLTLFDPQIKQLADVSAPAPSNNDVLTYQSSTGQWVNAAGGSGSGTVTSISAGVGLTASSNPITGSGSLQINSNQIIRAPVAYVTGGGSTPTAGAFAEITIPYAGTITNWSLAADVSGQAQFEIKRSGSSIIGSGNLPTLAGNENITQAVSGWTSTAIAAGDVIAYSLVSATTITRCGLTLTVNAT